MGVEGLIRKTPTTLEVPVGFIEGMRAPGRIYADEGLARGLELNSVRQVAAVATLPGLVGESMAMPDIHTGYGFPIGGVAAFSTEDGIVSPGGVGYDINCGVRLLRSNLTRKEVTPVLRELVAALYNEVPSGLGSKGKLRLSPKELTGVLTKGSGWALERGMGEPGDLAHTESGGCLSGADPGRVSPRALERGGPQQGTLGAGNHFLEIQYIDEIFDEAAAGPLGLQKGQVTVMIHTGSRGFGHQVCTDFLGVMSKAARKYGIELPDRELACAPFKSPEAREYIAAMQAAANYAWANRQCITHWVREVFQRGLKMSPDSLGMGLLYDVAHNMAKVESHEVDGRPVELVVHRKGATRAFPPGHPELPPDYRSLGQPVLVPGDMGRASYVLLGTERAMRETWGSTCHGAGRALSRSAARKRARGRSIARELEDAGVFVMSAGRRTLGEEMPEAYKDVNDVVDVVCRAGIARKVAKLRPMGVVKG